VTDCTVNFTNKNIYTELHTTDATFVEESESETPTRKEAKRSEKEGEIDNQPMSCVASEPMVCVCVCVFVCACVRVCGCAVCMCVCACEYTHFIGSC